MSANRLTQAAYQSLPGGPLDVDRSLYDSIASTAVIQPTRFVMPIRSGRAWPVNKGDVCRIIAIEGAQVGDLNIWSLHNPRERMWAARTRQLQRAHVSVYDRLWSTLPFLRPLVTITADSLRDYGTDSDGGRVHDLLGTRCDPYVNRMLAGVDFDYHCHSNLTRAIRPYGLTEYDVHDVLNVFQCTGLNDNDQYYMKTCPAKKGDYLEFIAETDILCALSTCPGGDLSKAMWGEGAADSDAALECCRPLGVEVWRLPAGFLEKRGWQEAAIHGRAYTGGHGLKEVEFAEVA
ncbi:hypothetical protein PLICRDRAFT_111179 [Plicaturopsis crispa FD-325 SS-3]|nr:hypothetical protein PLICRDRAFT_111179 [Plicaturopsis crispa FD-325 SS-3]